MPVSFKLCGLRWQWLSHIAETEIAQSTQDAAPIHSPLACQRQIHWFTLNNQNINKYILKTLFWDVNSYNHLTLMLGLKLSSFVCCLGVQY